MTSISSLLEDNNEYSGSKYVTLYVIGSKFNRFVSTSPRIAGIDYFKSKKAKFSYDNVDSKYFLVSIASDAYQESIS